MMRGIKSLIAVLCVALSFAPAQTARAQDAASLEKARSATGLDPRMPQWLPDGYRYEGLSVLPYHGKTIIHFRFGDGKTVLSFFQCPPRTRFDFGKKDRRKIRLTAGRGTFSPNPAGNVLIWTAHKNRLALVGPLEFELLKRVAESVR